MFKSKDKIIIVEITNAFSIMKIDTINVFKAFDA